MNRQTKRYYALYAVIFLFLFLLTSMDVSADEFDCSAGKHDFAVVTKEATEDEDGEITYTCQICGFTFSRILPATGHNWGKWIIDRQPTCTVDGHKYRVCTSYANDPHQEEAVIPATGHDYKEIITPPTCEKDGVKTYTCKRCGDTYTEPGEKAVGHQYKVEIIKKPDCLHKGKKRYTCEKCGNTYTKTYGKATGHHYTETIEKEASCELDGEKRYTCKKCGDSYTETIPRFGHEFGNWIIDKLPTEEEEGHRYKVCAHDSSHIVEEMIERLPKTKTEQEDPNKFPNTMDLVLLSAIATITMGFGVGIYRNVYVLHWGKKQSIEYLKWLKKNGYRK